MRDSLTRLKKSFRTALGISDSADFTSLQYQGIPEWDSVAHLQLVSVLESEFDIMLDTEDVLDLSSFEKAKTILAKYDIAFDA
jgi:acyl carrier protein